MISRPESIWRRAVVLTASIGRGDWLRHIEVGYATTSQCKKLRELEDLFSGTVQVINYINVHGEDIEPKPSGVGKCKLLEYVKKWLCGGDEKYERVKDLPLDEFEKSVRDVR